MVSLCQDFVVFTAYFDLGLCVWDLVHTYIAIVRGYTGTSVVHYASHITRNSLLGVNEHSPTRHYYNGLKGTQFQKYIVLFGDFNMDLASQEIHGIICDFNMDLASHSCKLM